jgi:hypothetical protein
VTFGHGAFLVVNSAGPATYYEWGLYTGASSAAGAQPGVITDNPSASGNLRSTITNLQFDNVGYLTLDSLKSALSQVMGTSGLYSSDTGMILGGQFQMGDGQLANVQTFVDNMKNQINAGTANYSVSELR